MLTFPLDPSPQQLFSHEDSTWSWDGQKWVKQEYTVEKVNFYARKPLALDETIDEDTGERSVTYKFDADSIKKNARLFEMDCNIKVEQFTGNNFYTFSPLHNVPGDVILQFTRGMRYVITQPEGEYETNPLTFYEDKSSLISFQRDPSIYRYTDGIIRDKNVITFRPTDDSPGTLLYGVESDTLTARIHLVNKYN